MMRRLSLVVLAGFAILTLLPASATASGPADCADPSLAAILGTAEAAGGEAAFLPDAQNKACIFICEPWGFTTAMHRGTGANCTDANNNLRSSVGGEASSTGPGLCNNAGAAFGYCGFNLVTTVSCHWDFVLGTYVADGYGNIKCKDYC
ncbi:MAG TPA: hypothetical protein VKK31_03705 [Thermoanaerobaculia bacterium]|nr:hypothetical protein [Thermoanaerobaculia bacterium]